MIPFLEPYKTQIDSFLQQFPRHRLIIWTGDVSQIPKDELISYWDVGSTMANRLDRFYESNSLSLEFDAECNEEKNLHIKRVDGTSYLVMYNFGILFDPLLGFNISAYLNSVSKNTVVVLISSGKYDNKKLYLSKDISNNSMNFFINLNDITHIVL